MTGGFPEPLWAVLVCAGLAAVLFWLRKKGFAQAAVTLRRRGGTMRVVERVHLTPQHSLHLVSLGDRNILVAASPANCQILEIRGGGGQ